MKSLRIHSYDSRNKTVKNRYSLEHKNTSFNEKPTPLDFDSFIPWFCLELQVSKNVIVRRTNQEEYIRYESKISKSSSTKSSKFKSRSTKTRLTRSSIESDADNKRISEVTKISFATSTVDITDAIPVTTCYDKRGRLVEIAIIGSPFEVPRKVIQAFNLCLPFHTGLSKLSIRKGGLSQIILYEISKLLLHSNITEICLDDSRLPGGNYSILLDRPSRIKYLSLKRCGINDEQCEKIAANLDLKGPATKTLLLLDLTSNNITDNGARAIGDMLKSNRYLLHLNLSGNYISDTGASCILRYLQEFLLTFNDIKLKSRRRMDYLLLRSNTFQQCLAEAKLARLGKRDFNVSSDQINLSIPHQSRHRKLKKHVVPSFIFEEMTVEDEAERKTTEILGEFEDPFEEQYVKRKGNLVYSTGNCTLTFLNLAYNNLTVLSLRNILKVLQYQCEIHKFTSGTGLVRVVIEGNNIPSQCIELYEIENCLKRAILENEHSIILSKKSSHFRQ